MRINAAQRKRERAAEAAMDSRQAALSQLRADWRYAADVTEKEIAATYDVECGEADGYIQNLCQNAVDAAVKLGVIEWDGENNGWHEGWTRMTRKLNEFAGLSYIAR